jgi:hypothetical protein
MIAHPFSRIDVVDGNNSLRLQFIEQPQSGSPVPFFIPQTSAGLVNAAEILLELFELPADGTSASPVIIEEPEALLGPGAIRVMRGAFMEASRTRQILIATHSPDLLDDPSPRNVPVQCEHHRQQGMQGMILGCGRVTLSTRRLGRELDGEKNEEAVQDAKG